MWDRFALALSFLTVFQLPFASKRTMTPADLAESFSCFPLVGLWLGICSFSLYFLFSRIMPTLLLGVWITAVAALLTRGLHLDGLADLFDGLGGGYTRERRLEIMKDSRSGAFGVLALVLAIALKIASLHAVLTAREWYPLLLVPALSRFSMVVLAYKMPYARPEGGLGQPFLEHMTKRPLCVAAGLSLCAAVLLSPGLFGLYLAAAIGTGLAFRPLSRRWLGGVTGDVLGAVNEVTEVILYSAAACLAGRL